jgi:predicted CXXCH cytochrome family protein
MKTILAGLIVCLLSASPLYSAGKHDCSFCHLPHAGGKSMLLKSPVNDLCLGCHPDRKSMKEHKVDITPSIHVENFPLSAEGKITCVTCHDPHRWSSPNLLRIEASELCLKCHPK